MKDVGVEQWKQANKVYIKLLDLTVGDAISQLHGMSEVSDEVKSLVLALISSGNLSSQFFNQQIGTSFEQPGWQESLLKAGDELAEYQIITELGHGGMASVYQAHRKGAEKQKSVAIKVFNRTQLTPILLNRFAVEQDILSGLSHPNIVNMHHGGSSESGMPYIVMDLIDEAQDIDDYCRINEVGQIEIVEFIIAAAHAIAYAHQNLIVHRDIKPSNLLIDGNHQLKVVDFGIAKLMGQQDAPQKTTILALTPSFAAPEQINSGQISVTTDVFSLAAVLLSLLIKKLPLPENRLLKSCVDDETHIWQLLKSNIEDRDLRNILNQALQQDPHKRYRNMDLFAEDLTAWVARKPVQATPDSWTYRITKFAQRRRALFAALSTLLVMVVLGIILLSWQVEKTRSEAKKAIQVKNFMLQVFSYADPQSNIAEKLSAYDLLVQAENEIQFQQFTDKRTQADILSAIGTAYSNLGSWDKGFGILSRVVELNPDDSSAWLKLIEIHLNKSETKLASVLINQIEKMPALLPGQQTLERADYLLVKSLNAIYEEQNEASLALAVASKSIFTALNNYNGILKSSRVIAERYAAVFNASDGLKEVANTLSMMKDKVSTVNTEMLRLLTTQIYLYIELSLYEEAKTNLGDLIQNIKSVLGEQHPALIDALVQRASVLRNTGDMQNAIKDSEESYQIAVEVYGAKSQMAQQSLSMLAQNRFATGDRKEALDLIKQVVEMSVYNFGEDHSTTLEAKSEYANYLGANGLIKEAIDVAQNVYNKQIEKNGINDKRSIYSANILLKLLSLQEVVGDDVLQLAIENNKRALANLDILHPQTAFSYFVLGTIYSKFEKFEESNKAYISLIENGSVKADHPRFIALSQSISDNYSAAEDQDKALDYARQSWHAAENILGPFSIRTIQCRLRMLKMIPKEQAEYQEHARTLLAMIEAGDISDESLIEVIKGI